MISFLLRPLLPWLVRRVLCFLAQGMGRDLRLRLPEVFEMIDAEVVPAIQRGGTAVSALFFTTVQRVVQRDPSWMEQRVLRILFDPEMTANRSRPPVRSDA
jgi:hypothetical protein